jgi:hypothetical protein
MRRAIDRRGGRQRHGSRLQALDKGPRRYVTATGTDSICGATDRSSAPAFDVNDDRIDMALQGSTQWDGLAHVSTMETLYNGFWVGTVKGSGSQCLSIDHLRASFVGRGVLLDFARHLGVEALEPGFRIEPGLLDEAASTQAIEIRAGDMLLTRTGYMSGWRTLATVAERERFEARHCRSRVSAGRVSHGCMSGGSPRSHRTHVASR